MKSDIRQYQEYLDELVGAEGECQRVTEEHEQPPIWVVSYPDIPEEGSTTAFSYGLSLVEPPDLKEQPRELLLSVNSDNPDWAFALGLMVQSFRGSCPFVPGNVIKFGERIDPESDMTAFVAYLPMTLDEEDTRIRLPDKTIQLIQMYPIYEEEISLLEEIGVDAFFADEEVDFTDVYRPMIEGLEES